MGRGHQRRAGGGTVCLAGGVGAARFLRGLVRVLDPTTITVVVNTADDVERHGLWVSPDIDSVVYGLAGLGDEERGWGLAGETWGCLEALSRLGEETWFQLGDHDLATHIWRSWQRRSGRPLSAITAAQCAALGVPARVLPMTDQVVTTRMRCRGFAAELHLQEWLVRERCAPPVESVRYTGVERARPAPGVLEAIEEAAAVVVCPSNPVISIGPILAVPGIRDALRAAPRSIAITPIVAGAAVKGPAAELLAQQGVEVSAAGVARLYADFCRAMVVDRRDPQVAAAVAAAGVEPVLAETVMDGPGATDALAEAVCRALGLDRPPAAAA
jgi:LPPG:FO 2-phospho-L-lactate transferase